MTLPRLTADEQRVLGCLLEKEVTVPDTYPLTLNALRSACNQKSSRDPIVDFDERTVQDAVRALKDGGLARVAWADYGRRTLKYLQTATHLLGLADDERALITVLLLRGPQSPGELRARTDRLYTFADREAVEACLERMAARDEPLVLRLERRPGQQDHRWIHLLGDPPPDAAPAAEDREAIRAGGPAERDAAVVAGYDAVADAEALTASVSPFEGWFLDRVAALAHGRPVVDVGCGAGTAAGALAAAGADVFGIDVSPGMVAAAQARYPGVDFSVGDLRRLLRPAAAPGWGAVVAWFSLLHFAPSELPAVVGGLGSVLVPDGVLAIALPVGGRDGRVGPDGLAVVRHEAVEVRRAVAAAGLTAVESYLVSDGGDDERLYLIARR